MASLGFGKGSWLLVICLALILLPGKAHAFGAGNIPSIAKVEGHNWRHGDIEDMLETIAFLNGKKWTSLMIGRVYFGNWLRDYSQAIDVGSLKGVNAATVRILIWVLSFMAHGYATDEFEVTEERLGCYRPEEHIDNPLGYAEDAKNYDPRLRGPVDPVEVEIDPRTGMKNYIANESGGWATSAGYLRFSIGRSIHFGRLYTSGSGGSSGREDDLNEALRCLGQALHTLEDFPAHSNYCELALRELGHHEVFAHCGADTEIDLKGRRVFPLVTGTFGAVDFIHSVLGEANDHFTQSEVDEMNQALINAQGLTKAEGESSSRGLFGSSGRSSGSSDFISLVSKLPGIGDGFASEARELQRSSAAQQEENSRSMFGSSDNQNVIPGMSADFDPVKTAGRIYPILQFRDKIVKAINRFIAKVPGLEKLLEHISETLTAFILGLLAPFIQPIIQQVTKVLKDGSSGLINASARSQYEPWDNPSCSDPTHSMLSKDHFTNVLQSVSGQVAVTILQYAVPRILYAWENPGVPVDEVLDDILRALHHPVMRSDRVEIQRNMFNTVKEWAEHHPRRHELNRLLSSQSVKDHKNHVQVQQQHGERSMGGDLGCGGHGKTRNGLWGQIKSRDRSAMTGGDMRPIGSGAVPSGQGDFGYQQSDDQSHIYKGDDSGAAASYYGGSDASAPPQPSYDRPPQQSYGQGPPQPSYGAPPPQQGYGQPPPGQWGPPPGQYGGPPPGQYGGPPPGQYGGPPPGQYGGPPPGQYGGPPPGQYGGPPPGQYGGPPGPYGQPPPPHQGGGYGGYPGQQYRH